MTKIVDPDEYVQLGIELPCKFCNETFLIYSEGQKGWQYCHECAVEFIRYLEDTHSYMFEDAVKLFLKQP